MSFLVMFPLYFSPPPSLSYLYFTSLYSLPPFHLPSFKLHLPPLTLVPSILPVVPSSSCLVFLSVKPFVLHVVTRFLLRLCAECYSEDSDQDGDECASICSQDSEQETPETENVSNNSETFCDLIHFHTACKTLCPPHRETSLSLSVSLHPAPRAPPLQHPLHTDVEAPRRAPAEPGEQDLMAAGVSPGLSSPGTMKPVEQHLCLWFMWRKKQKRTPLMVNTWNHIWICGLTNSGLIC